VEENSGKMLNLDLNSNLLGYKIRKIKDVVFAPADRPLVEKLMKEYRELGPQGLLGPKN
jgi:hypothetical protein